MIVLKGKSGVDFQINKREWRPLKALMMEHCPCPLYLGEDRLRAIFDFSKGKPELTRAECEWASDCLELAVNRIMPERYEKKEIEYYNSPAEDGGRCIIAKCKIDQLLYFLNDCNGFTRDE